MDFIGYTFKNMIRDQIYSTKFFHFRIYKRHLHPFPNSQVSTQQNSIATVKWSL